VGNASIYHLQKLVLGLLLIVENVTGDVNHLNHGSGLVVEPNEICDLKLNVLGVLLLDYFIVMDSNFGFFHLE